MLVVNGVRTQLLLNELHRMHAHGEIQLGEWKAYVEEKEVMDELSIGADVGFPCSKLRTDKQQVQDRLLRAAKHLSIAKAPNSEEEEVYLFAEVIIDHIFKLKVVSQMTSCHRFFAKKYM
jgi:hypothetical protein